MKVRRTIVIVALALYGATIISVFIYGSQPLPGRSDYLRVAAIMGSTYIPLCFVPFWMKQNDRRALLEKRWAEWDIEHPHPSEAYKDAIEQIRK